MIGLVGLALVGTSVAGFLGWWEEHEKVSALQTEVAELKKQEQRSAVIRSVSNQMEEIAYQQKEISDEQREEAQQQTLVADEMRRRSEVERQNALVAQDQAMASERQAQMARLVAEEERQMAEHERVKAELSKRIADTLSYVALGRSLGSLASIQAQSGNADLASLLSYSSYLYTSRYNGDVFYPAVFQALMQTSRSTTTLPMHTGVVSAISSMPKGDDRMVTASRYGELMIHSPNGDNNLTSSFLLKNANYDFRDIFIRKDGTIYAVSRSGHIAIVHPDKNNSLSILTLNEMGHPMWLSQLDEQRLLVVGDQDIAVLDMVSNSIVGMRHLDAQVVDVARTNSLPLLFDNKQHMHVVHDLNKFDSRKVPVRGQVTAFAESKESHQSAYGTNDGTIYLVDSKGQMRELIGHRSRISHLKMNGPRLYSSSYDGTLNLWVTQSDKIEPLPLLSTGQWMISFTFDNSKHHLYLGDQNGNLTIAQMTIDTMVEKIHNQLTRDFTTDEWNYYIGKNVPYESYVGK